MSYEYFVIRLPKEYKEKIKEVLKVVEKRVGFKITQVEFIRSAIELKIEELKKGDEE